MNIGMRNPDTKNLYHCLKARSVRTTPKYKNMFVDILMYLLTLPKSHDELRESDN